ncbi:hypothetical protein ACEPAG_9308 [Sanghuangporus baumii]
MGMKTLGRSRPRSCLVAEDPISHSLHTRNSTSRRSETLKGFRGVAKLSGVLDQTRSVSQSTGPGPDGASTRVDQQSVTMKTLANAAASIMKREVRIPAKLVLASIHYAMTMANSHLWPRHQPRMHTCRIMVAALNNFTWPMFTASFISDARDRRSDRIKRAFALEWRRRGWHPLISESAPVRSLRGSRLIFSSYDEYHIGEVEEEGKEVGLLSEGLLQVL